MKYLHDLNLLSNYSKDQDILSTFYQPCIERATRYHRISGYFSSAIFDIASDAFVQFFKNGGVYELVCSPKLNLNDAQALTRPQDPTDGTSLETESLLELLADPRKRDTAQVMCFLITKKLVVIKLAISNHLMHEKIGIFANGNARVSFSGSINETAAGWSHQGNREYMDAFVSWNERDLDRVNAHEKRFNQYWSDAVEGVEVRPPSNDFETIVTQHSETGKTRYEARVRSAARKFPYEPLTYQAQVLDNWKLQGRVGLVQFCTGAGKTVVGLKAIEWSISQAMTAFILVPSAALLNQWADEVTEIFPDAALLLAGDGNNLWKKKGVLEAQLAQPGDKGAVIIATSGTAMNSEFLRRAGRYDHVLFIADEVHNYGAKKASEILNLPFTYRLALSATPERYGDPEGTSKIYSYFGPTLTPIIDIPTAIIKKRLVPYRYDFEVARLSHEEQDSWDKLTKEISRLVAQKSGALAYGEDGQPSTLQMKILARSRIAKKAEAKLHLGIAIFEKHFKPGQKWLIFLEDTEEVNEFGNALQSLGHTHYKYDQSLNTKERELVVQNFTLRGGVILSMKCLDEGVDIPSISHSIILASSQNPRQFVQRRGRVLRFAGSEKLRAFIWDVIAMPQINSEDTTKALILAEIARASEFAAYSENSIGVLARLTAMLAEHGLSIEDCERREMELDDNIRESGQ